MKVYSCVILELLFLIAFVGSWIPYCLNQSSDFWFILGVVSIFFVPIEIYHFIYEMMKPKGK